MVRPIAIYLPQFHPIPENDAAWGKGFTEWTNVKKAVPLFEDHYQPHVPHKDVGYYDLRDPEVLVKQAAIAKEYGIYGFAFYHYWFNGKQLLNSPIDNVLKLGKPDFPFMLIWANENWTRVWDGGSDDIILKQNYSEEDDRNHICVLISYFKDNRYIKIDNKPVIAIYRSTLLPDPGKTIEIWREEAKKAGFDLYICRVESFGEEGTEYLKDGFDAGIEFEPHKTLNFYMIKNNSKKLKTNRLERKIRKLFNKTQNYLGIKTNAEHGNYIIDYKEFVNKSIINSSTEAPYKKFNCAMPGFDNSSRKKDNYLIIKNTSPDVFKYWIKVILENFTPFSKEENLFFINAWNEWAEGNHLEPCQKWGKAFLQKLQEGLNEIGLFK
jgi:lipopolysaccharide biosynthesis protein